MFKNILIIGPYAYKKRPKTIGGATNLLKNFRNYLIDNKIDHNFISTNSYGYFFSFLMNFIIVFIKSILLIPFSRVIMVNTSQNGAFYLFPIIFLLSKMFRKKIIFRMFGGNFINLYEDSFYLTKKILLYCLTKTDIIFFETNYIINYCKKLIPKHKKITWFPNIRNNPKIDKEPIYKKRFAFMSHIRYSKGVENILEVSNLLSDEYSIDFYGSFMGNKYNSEYIDSYKNCNYRGVIDGSEVQKTLEQYDFILLPTFYSGEGYPGIIIESFSVGLPVIATKLKGISEIVEHNKNGILVPVKDTQSLLDAILSINEKKYINYSKNAKLSFKKFDSSLVNSNIINHIYKLIK